MVVNMNKLILAGDIGGTKTLLHLLITDGKQYKSVYSQRYVSAEYANFESLLDAFLQAAQSEINNQKICTMCLGIAGPVQHRHAQITNLPWQIDADVLEQTFGIAQVRLINDFMAVGYGIDMLSQGDLYCLQTGAVEDKAARVVIGAGTGLGQGYLVWQNGKYVPQPSEGSHVDFAPTNLVQIELLKYLQVKYGHVSYERVASGSGLINIYEFLASTQVATAAMEHALQTAEDKAAIISTYAVQQKDMLAEQALDIFIETYGAQAGNLALTCLARGGVYIAGGIAPKIIQRMARGDFMRAFRAKGRFSTLMESMPVYVITNAEVGLQGAIRLAMQTI